MTPSPPPFRATVRVRYAETDQMGVVYYANFFIWFEIARVELLRALGFDYKQMELADDCHLPVVEASCRYKSPALYDDLVVIETRVIAMRSFMLKFAYKVYRADSPAKGKTPGQLLATGETTHVIVGRGMKKSALPDKYAEAIRATMNHSLVEDD